MKTLEMVKEYNPLLILSGKEKGCVLATRFNDDLDFLGNSYENIKQ